jgi:integrase
VAKRPIRLTQTTVAQLPATGNDYRVFDITTPMFNIRVSKQGVKTFYFCFRNQSGRQRWYRIGRADAMTVEAARMEARRLQASVDRGNDPLTDRQATRSEPTMSDLWEAYLQQHALPKKKLSSVEEDKRLWRLHLSPAFSGEKVRSLSLASIRKLHADMGETPGAANRSLALLSKMLSFAVDNEWRDMNPCSRVQKYPDQRKNRYLSEQEFVRLWSVLDSDRDQCASTIIKLLMLTGARRGEVLAMKWSDLDLSGSEPNWTLRSGEQKGERGKRSDFIRPLGREASDLLNQWRQSHIITSLHWVFPSERKTGAYRSEIKFAWNRIRNAAGIKDVRIHDLRHTYASFAINAGVPLEAIGATLGHKDLRTTMRYAHLTDKTMRSTVDAVGSLFAQYRSSL